MTIQTAQPSATLPSVQTLDYLHPGQQGIIEAIDADESLYYRLNALGFRIGKLVRVVRRGTLNGPMQIKIGSTQIMLRLSEAHRIKLQAAQ